jgi:outer membrane protein assembly factor BamD (BamD/ComL family)
MCLACGAWLCAAGAASAQESYRLGEDDRWALAAPPDPGTPEGQLAAIRKALASGDAARAEHLATRWIERNPAHPALAMAYLHRGDARKARGEEYEALFDYEYIAREFPGSEVFVTALERELEVARMYAAGRKRKLWGLRLVSGAEEAEELFIRIQERLPGSALAEQAGLALGDFYFRRSEMSLAADAYAIFLESHPRSAQVGLARRRLIYAHLAAFKGPDFDAGGLDEARTRLRQLKTLEPAGAERIGADAILERIDDSHARKLLATAGWYRARGDAIAAELTLRRLLRRFPRTPAAREAVALAVTLLDHLPETVRRTCPDYAALAAADDGAPPAAEPAP